MNDLDDALMIGLKVETESRPELGKTGRVLCITPQKARGDIGLSRIEIKDTTDLERAKRTILEYDPGIIISSLGR